MQNIVQIKLLFGTSHKKEIWAGLAMGGGTTIQKHTFHTTIKKKKKKEHDKK